MKKRILICFFVLLICFSVLVWQGIYLPKDVKSLEERPFLIKKGESIFQIAKNLEKENLIKNRIYFEMYLFLTGNVRKLRAGEYLLLPSMTIPQIAKKIVSGDVIKEKITIIEGWNLRDIGWYFENIFALFQAEELFELIGFPLVDYNKNIELPRPRDFSQEFDFLKDKPENLGLEGYLFPDTYEINKGSTIGEIVRKMLQNFDKKLTQELREEINRQEKTIFEIVTMASMLEKEVKTSEDKKLVSGILWKRLENNIPLQVDATITYITGKKTTKISKEETEIDSPYNAYKYPGLPLGPISNPSLDSILAAIYPKESDFWYYLSTSEGETIFTTTLEEHNVAKQNI